MKFGNEDLYREGMSGSFALFAQSCERYKNGTCSMA